MQVNFSTVQNISLENSVDMVSFGVCTRWKGSKGDWGRSTSADGAGEVPFYVGAEFCPWRLAAQVLLQMELKNTQCKYLAHCNVVARVLAHNDVQPFHLFMITWWPEGVLVPTVQLSSNTILEVLITLLSLWKYKLLFTCSIDVAEMSDVVLQQC